MTAPVASGQGPPAASAGTVKELQEMLAEAMRQDVSLRGALGQRAGQAADAPAWRQAVTSKEVIDALPGGGAAAAFTPTARPVADVVASGVLLSGSWAGPGGLAPSGWPPLGERLKATGAWDLARGALEPSGASLGSLKAAEVEGEASVGRGRGHLVARIAELEVELVRLSGIAKTQAEEIVRLEIRAAEANKLERQVSHWNLFAEASARGTAEMEYDVARLTALTQVRAEEVSSWERNAMKAELLRERCAAKLATAESSSEKETATSERAQQRASEFEKGFHVEVVCMESLEAAFAREENREFAAEGRVRQEESAASEALTILRQTEQRTSEVTLQLQETLRLVQQDAHTETRMRRESEERAARRFNELETLVEGLTTSLRCSQGAADAQRDHKQEQGERDALHIRSLESRVLELEQALLCSQEQMQQERSQRQDEARRSERRSEGFQNRAEELERALRLSRQEVQAAQLFHREELQSFKLDRAMQQSAQEVLGLRRSVERLRLERGELLAQRGEDRGLRFAFVEGDQGGDAAGGAGCQGARAGKNSKDEQSLKEEAETAASRAAAAAASAAAAVAAGDAAPGVSRAQNLRVRQLSPTLRRAAALPTASPALAVRADGLAGGFAGGFAAARAGSQDPPLCPEPVVVRPCASANPLRQAPPPLFLGGPALGGAARAAPLLGVPAAPPPATAEAPPAALAEGLWAGAGWRLPAGDGATVTAVGSPGPLQSRAPSWQPLAPDRIRS